MRDDVWKSENSPRNFGASSVVGRINGTADIGTIEVYSEAAGRLPELRRPGFTILGHFHLSEFYLAFEDGVFRVATTAFISNVPEVKMVSTSKPSASAISVESIVASVESVVATVVASVVMSVEPFVVDCSLVVSVHCCCFDGLWNRLNQYR